MGVYGFLWVLVGFWVFLSCRFWVFIVFIGFLPYLLIQHILFVFDIINFYLISLIDFNFWIEIHNLKVFYLLQQETV